MNPMLVYFLMMADNIKGCFIAFAIAAGASTAIAWFGRFITAAAVYDSDIKNDTSDYRTWLAWCAAARRVPWFFAIAVLPAVFMPNTKTIAAMVVLPKLTSPQALDAMGSEAKELYDLAKGALKNLAQDEQPASKE